MKLLILALIGYLLKKGIIDLKWFYRKKKKEISTNFEKM